MSSRPWKNVNSRTKTNSIDVIHCDELITDELNTKNLDLNITATVRRQVNTNSFDISKICDELCKSDGPKWFSNWTDSNLC